MTDEVLFHLNDNGAATILLNRPNTLNSLSLSMIRAIGTKLAEWRTDSKISVVVIKGAGAKGLCAGGDIKKLYEARKSESALQEAERFFEEEYEVDMAIHLFPKPIIAILDGIVMGGGVGLTYGASHRIVTERTKWSMPETNIGFFPDVGGAYFLNMAPGYIGRYLALTGSLINAPDVLHILGADNYMKSESIPDFLNRVETTDWTKGQVEERLNQLITEYETKPTEESWLNTIRHEIDEHFRFTTVEDILSSLEREGNDFCKRTKEVLCSKSPLSLKVTLKQLIEGKNKPLKECFAIELLLAKKFLRHRDFYEGVRSVLIDRDQSPNYEYNKVSDVKEDILSTFFTGESFVS